MSQENVQFAQDAYADSRGMLGIRDRVAPDAVFDFSAAYPDMPIIRGPDEVLRFREAGPWAD